MCCYSSAFIEVFGSTFIIFSRREDFSFMNSMFLMRIFLNAKKLSKVVTTLWWKWADTYHNLLKKYEVTIQIKKEENRSKYKKAVSSQLVVSTDKKERCKYWHFAIHSRLGKLRIAGWCQLSDSHVK